MQKKPLLLAAAVLLMLCAFRPSLALAQADDGSNDTSVIDVPSSTSSGTAAVAPVAANETGGDQVEAGDYESAIVQTAQSITQGNDSGAQQLRQYTVQFLSGPEKGQTRTLTNDISDDPYSLNPAPGDKVLIFLQPDPNGGPPLAYIESFERRDALYWLIGFFVLTLVVLAGWQGLKIALSIGFSLALIGLVLIPSFLKGINPVPIAFLIIAILATVSTGLSIGWNRKTVVTIIGTLGGVAVAYLVSLVFAHWAHLSGLATDDDRLFFDKNPNLNPQGLLFAGIAIASLGVVEDVAVSIASGVMEVRQANMRLGFKELFRSGMIIGRDHMGALANTLVFAYVGGSLSTLLLYSEYGGSWAKFVNFDSIVDEVIRSLAGTIGLIFTVPITALLAAWFALRMKPPNSVVQEAQGWRGEHKHIHADTH
ncbi:MAG: YibE/F family protein [Patescibacteria group bacterium]